VKKFVFKLQPVLVMRLQLEQQALQELGITTRAYQQTVSWLKAVKQETAQAGLMPLAVEYEQQREKYLLRLRIRTAELAYQLKLQAEEMHKARAAAAKAQAERKAVERLRERRMAEWRIEMGREEDRDLAEAGSR
jgi:flagellar FliJ protein